MAQQTQLGVMGLPGRVLTFSAKPVSQFDITYLEPVQVALGMWVLRWTSSSAGPFTVYRDGVKLGVTYNKRFTIQTEEDSEAVLVEVIADPAGVPTVAESARHTIQWGSVVGDTDHYKVERLIGAAWSEVGRIKENGAAIYGYRSDPLDDDANHQFRVSAVARSGNAGAPLPLSRYAVRHPDPPDDATISYDPATGKIAVENMI